MSKANFESLWNLLHSGMTPAEVVDRIEQGELRWRDDFGRIIAAGPDEISRVRENLKLHHLMLTTEVAPWYGESSANNPVGKYQHDWENPPDEESVEKCVVGRAGFVPGNTPKSDKPMATTERNTLLTLIAALCDCSAIDHQARGSSAQIAAMTDEIGAPVTDDTIRKVLRQIPAALEARKK